MSDGSILTRSMVRTVGGNQLTMWVDPPGRVNLSIIGPKSNGKILGMSLYGAESMRRWLTEVLETESAPEKTSGPGEEAE